MSEIKWIKIYTNIFDNRKIKQIETLPDGDTILVIWLKLLTLAGNINDSGLVYFTKEIPYTDDMLATQFNKPLATVKMALSVFESYGMIEIVNDIVCISNWEKYQNIDGMEKVREQNRARKQAQRLREKETKMLESNVTRHVTVTQGHAIEQEQDKEQEEDIEIDNCCLLSSSTNSNNLKIVEKFFKNLDDDEFKKLYPKEFERLKKFLSSLPSEELKELDSLDKCDCTPLCSFMLSLYDNNKVINKEGYLRTVLKNPLSFLETNTNKMLDNPDEWLENYQKRREKYVSSSV